MMFDLNYCKESIEKLFKLKGINTELKLDVDTKASTISVLTKYIVIDYYYDTKTYDLMSNAKYSLRSTLLDYQPLINELSQAPKIISIIIDSISA